MWATALIERRLGPLADRPRSSVRSPGTATAGTATDGTPGHEASPARWPGRRGGRPAVDARMQRLAYRRWIDDPNERLSGLSPRDAAGRPEQREELERQLRSLEHHAARERDDGRPGPEVASLRAELGLEGERLAA